LDRFVEMLARYCEPPIATAERYRRVAIQMLNGKKHVGSMGGFSEARAALVHHAVITARAILDTPTHAQTAEMVKALAEAKKFLALFPPGGGAGLVYEGKRTTKLARKKRILRLEPDWRSTVFEIAKDCFPDHAAAVAVLELTGLRRAELAMGVQVQRREEGLRLDIQGAKVNQSRGQPARALIIALSHPRAAWLSEALRFSEQGMATVQINKHYLNYVITACAREAFPSFPDSLLPTPKTYRDQLSADLKKVCSPVEVATVLGHLSERSQAAYAGSRYARGSVSWIDAASTSREIKMFRGINPSELQHDYASETSHSAQPASGGTYEV
jgi:hypothetical protein